MIKYGRSFYLADTATIIGDVTIGDNVTIMDSAVIRGDQNKIFIGDNSNIQDNATVHVNSACETRIGKNVSVGHNAVVHGAIIDDDVLIGMGAIILNNAHIRSGSVIAAGTVVTENFDSPENTLIAGIPGEIKKVDRKYHEMAYENSLEYLKLNDQYRNKMYMKLHGWEKHE